METVHVHVWMNSLVIILQGELKGNTVKLIRIDCRDGFVKMALNFDIKFVEMLSLAVYLLSPSYPPSAASHSQMSPVYTRTSLI